VGSSKETTTTTTTVPGAGGQETAANDILRQLAQGGLSQLGDLSGLASGNVQISPEDRAFIEEISRLSQKAAANNIRSNAAETMGAVEANALERGIGSSTIEAVNKAVGMRQMQESLDQSAISGQITTAQQLREQALSRAGLQLNANQLLLQRILGGASQLSAQGLQERLTQATTTGVTEKPFDWGGAINAASQIGSAAVGNA